MNVPLDEVIYFDCITTHPSTGAATDADSTPTFAVYEESTDTDIGVGGNLTKRTSLTGNYRGTFTLSAANGFEVGKWYSIIGSATVNSIAGKAVIKNFRVVAAEGVTGKVKADVDAYLGSSTLVNNLTTIFNTDYASVYNTTAKCLVVQLDNNVAHGGGAATLELGSTSTVPLIIANSGGHAVQFTASGGNGDAFQLAANGTGSAFKATGGATGHGALLTGGATSGNGLKAVGTAGNSAAVSLVGQGTQAGLLSTGGATGAGVEFVGGATSGAGLYTRAATSGAGISAAGAGTGAGMLSSGGATGYGITAAGGGTSGYGMLMSGSGAFTGLAISGGDTGAGLAIAGGATSGDGVSITTTSGHGVNIAPVGTAKHGVKIAGGNGATADGINVAAGTGGVAVRVASHTVTGASTYTGVAAYAAGITVAQSSLNSAGILIAGNGTAAGIDISGGATGDGILVAAGGGSARAIHAGSLTIDGTTVLTGAVSMGSTFAVASTATLNALTVTNATTLSGAVTATNASNDVRGVALHATQAAYAVSTVTTAQVNAEVLDVINVDTLIDGKTIKEAVRAIAATTTGKVSGAGTGTEVFVGMDGTTVRVTATVDASGNRTGITYA